MRKDDVIGRDGIGTLILQRESHDGLVAFKAGGTRRCNMVASIHERCGYFGGSIVAVGGNEVQCTVLRIVRGRTESKHKDIAFFDGSREGTGKFGLSRSESGRSQGSGNSGGLGGIIYAYGFSIVPGGADGVPVDSQGFSIATLKGVNGKRIGSNGSVVAVDEFRIQFLDTGKNQQGRSRGKEYINNLFFLL